MQSQDLSLKKHWTEEAASGAAQDRAELSPCQASHLWDSLLCGTARARQTSRVLSHGVAERLRTWEQFLCLAARAPRVNHGRGPGAEQSWRRRG